MNREEMTHTEEEVQGKVSRHSRSNTNLSKMRLPSSTSDWATLVLSPFFGPGATVESLTSGAEVARASSTGFFPSVAANSVGGAEINALI